MTDKERNAVRREALAEAVAICNKILDDGYYADEEHELLLEARDAINTLAYLTLAGRE